MRLRTAFLFAVFSAAGSLPAQKTPDEALALLRSGNERFVNEQSVLPPLGDGYRRSLARGQSPYAIVLTCADSRVVPEHLFNAGLGDLFVIRIAGNACDPDTLASIEYAAEHLATPLCVVLGHESCGAVAATIAELQGKMQPESQSLATLLEHLQPAVRVGLAENLGGKELSRRAEEENAEATALDCLRRSPVLQLLSQQKRFRILPARYHLDNGAVEWLPERPLLQEPPAEPKTASHAAGLPPHVAMLALQAGHRRFLSAGKPIGDISLARRQGLTKGQHPFAIVVTCSDSRVPPEHIFDAGLGELFVIRVAGNLLNDEVLASIEYAAAHTGSPLLVVMGHTGCGAVTAASQANDSEHLSANMRSLLSKLEPAVERARHDHQDGAGLVADAVRINVLRTLQLARTQSHILRELEHEGRFAMAPAIYNLATGDIEWLKDTPAVDTAAPPAAPMGETAPVHGDVNEHGAPRSEHGSEATPTGHGATPGHGSEGATALAEELPQRPYADAAVHGVQLEAPAQPSPPAIPWWRSPEASLTFGVCGMTSLLFAGWLVLQRRG